MSQGDTNSTSNSSSSNLNASTTAETSQSHVTGRNVALVQESRYTPNTDSSLMELPSHTLRHSLWHDLRAVDVPGSRLKAPRIRAGPGIDKFADKEDDRGPIHHDLKGREYKRHRNATEDWENTHTVNLCFQDLHHEYQRQNFHRVLDRVNIAYHINLTDNGLMSLASHTFNSCAILVLDNNYISSFTKLPRLPRIKYLSVKCNDIASLHGLARYHKTPLEELWVQGNPVTFTQENFRQRVFQALPGLRTLDNVPRLNADMEFDHRGNDGRSCVIS